MKDIVLVKDIMDIYTRIVESYIKKGYMISIASSHGVSNNQICKTDFTDGKSVYRIFLSYDTDFEDHIYLRNIILTVEMFEGRAETNKFRDDGILWDGKGKLLCKKEWYGVDYQETTYTSNKVFAIECYETRCKRARTKDGIFSKDRDLILTDKSRRIIRDICRKTRGYMKINDNDIARLEIRTFNEDRYYTAYFNNGKRSLMIKHIKQLA